MKDEWVSNFSGGKRQQELPPTVSRRRTLSVCVATAMLGVSLIAVHDAQAAGGKKKSKHKAPSSKEVNELREENQRLQEQIQQLLNAQNNGGAVAAPVEGGLPAAAGEAQPEAVAEAVQEPVEETKDLGEVVVSARRAPSRLARLKEVPSSSSVVTGQRLNQQITQDMQGILQRAGNVRWNPGNSRTSSLSIRGVGQQAQTDAMDPSVGTALDGVPYAYNPLTSFDQFDVDQVEVDRGPQGTKGGKNANMGAIRINSRRPTFTREAEGSLSYGDYNTYIANAALGGAVIDDLLAWRGAIHVNKSDGATPNHYNEDQTWYNRDRVAGRIQFLLTPVENFNARFSFDMQPETKEFYNGNSIYTPTPKNYINGAVNPLSTDASTRLGRRWFTKGDPNYTYEADYLYGGVNNKGNNGKVGFNMDNQFPLVTSSKGGSVDLNWTLGDVKLQSITGVRDYEFQARNDEGTPFDISKNGGGAVPNFLQVSQELRLESKFRNLLDYSAGYLYLDREQTKGNRVGFGESAGAWFASNSQYKILDATTGKYAPYVASGNLLMTNSLNGLDTNGPYFIHNQSNAIFGNTKWHVTDELALTAGVRFSKETREQATQKLIVNNGAGAALNPVFVNNVQTGGFDSNAAGNLVAGNSAEQIALANSVAKQYFNVATYAGLNATQKTMVATAKNLRKTNMGNLWQYEPGVGYNAIQPSYVVSPSYKINEDISTYVSWQYGEKAGFSQTPNGIALRVEPEKASSYEIGLKSTLFDKSLTFNVDFFYTGITNYQQAVQVVDQYATDLARQSNPSAPATYISTTGNAAGVRALGVEIDGSYTGIPYTSINFSGAFNDAIYTDFKNSAKPPEQNFPGSSPYRDVTGMTLPGASQFTFNIGPEFRIPLEALNLPYLNKTEFHTSFNTSFTSSYNSDVTLSAYSYIHASSYTDFAIGVGRRDKLFDISFVSKNLFNNTTPSAVTWNSYSPGMPQWFGVLVSGKL